MTQVGHAIGGDLPELRVEHLERDMAVVADAAQVVEDRPELEVALARQDPVARRRPARAACRSGRRPEPRPGSADDR